MKVNNYKKYFIFCAIFNYMAPQSYRMSPYIDVKCFSVEFIGYYLDRNNRMESMKQQLAVLLEENSKLLEEQQQVQNAYDEVPTFILIIHRGESSPLRLFRSWSEHSL